MKRLTAAGLAVLFFSAAALGGDTVWTRRYDGGFGDEEARAVLVDGSGNVIVVGSSAGGATARDYVVIKYSPNGAPLWTTRVAGQSGSYDDARAAAIDAAGAVYVTGSSGYFPNYNYMTAKVNSNGSEVWRAHYGSPGNGTDYAVAVAADSLGYSYVTGYVSDSAGGSNDIVTIKYNPDSSRSWVMIYDGGGSDRASAIALGPDRSVFVTGASIQGSYDDVVTIKYSNAGVEEWVRHYNGAGNAIDQGVALVTDAAGNVYVTGTSGTAPPPGGHYDYVTLKYDGAGNRGWVKRYNAASRGDEPVGIVAGAAAVYVTGKSYRSGDYDFATVAYNPSNGDTVWVRRYDGPANKDDEASGIAIDAAGRIHVVGTCMDANNRRDYCRVRYSASGRQEDAVRFNATFDNDDVAAGIAVDREFGVVVTGTSFGEARWMNYDIQTVKYDSAVGLAVLHGVPAPKPALQVWPNPARTVAWARRPAPEDREPLAVALYDATGVLRASAASAEEPVVRLDLTGLAPGVYVVRARSAGTPESARLVVR